MKYKVFTYTYQAKDTKKVYSGTICATNLKEAKKLFNQLELGKDFKKIGVA